jgi:signal transduction histidine kinase/CheY-like chemotaxis protein
MGGGTHEVFLSTVLPGRSERRLALTVLLASIVVFLAALPFAKVPLTPVWAFIPIYESALVINDLITAVLLFGQFGILHSPALLVLACGYLFTAFMTVSHALTFPGLFSPTGLLGAGPQSTAWLYMFWHGGFPLFVIAYAQLKAGGGETSRLGNRTSLSVFSGVGAALAVVAGLTLLATAGQDTLPAIMRGHHYTPAMSLVVSSVWGTSLLALLALWRRRPHSVLDLWLMVVMFAWLCDIALAAVLNAGRFDLGFYAGRIYGLLAASFVLLALLLENGRLYARLVDVYRELGHHNRSLEQLVAERTQRLLQSEKVATMGSLLAGVAHELNNPLAILLGQAHLLRERPEPSSLVQRAEKIKAAGERCARIVGNFLSLARQRPPERRDVGFNQVVRDAVELLAYELRTSSVEVVLDLAEGLPTLWADPHQLHQVVVNLVGNAHQAMRHQASARRIVLRTRLDPTRRRVRLEVADTGPGIPAEIRSKIFEAFFTTKAAGEGTGLGLSLCRGIVEEHGGTLTVESEPGRGATFVVELPLQARPMPTQGPAEVERLPALTPKAILVIDDEPDMAATLAEALQRDGHQVDVATDGSMALDMLARRAYDLLLSDTQMPKLDGKGLYHEVARRFPALLQRMIFVTGDVLDRQKREFLESTGALCLAKPFDLDDVRRVIHRVLAGVSAR